MNRTSRVTQGVIGHTLLDRARKTFVPMCRDAGDGIVLLLLGPTQCGKSVIFHEVIKALKDSFIDSRIGAMPVVDLQIETVSEGRTKPKWLGLELLKALHHPLYKYIGAFDENEHYFPSKGRDETTIRIALKEAFTSRFTRRVALDEAHLLTRTKDPELRASILESIKSSCAIDRSLIACGGYELAYNGLFDSAHFCGRVIHFDFGNYLIDSEADVISWVRILKTYSNALNLKPASLLIDEAINLLYWSNGTLGLLDKHLWSCSARARVLNEPIDRKLLRACAPPERERKAIAEDIRRGKEALRASASRDSSEPAMTSPASVADASRKSSPRAAFERKPNRHAAEEVQLHDDD